MFSRARALTRTLVLSLTQASQAATINVVWFVHLLPPHTNAQVITCCVCTSKAECMQMYTNSTNWKWRNRKVFVNVSRTIKINYCNYFRTQRINLRFILWRAIFWIIRKLKKNDDDNVKVKFRHRNRWIDQFVQRFDIENVFIFVFFFSFFHSRTKRIEFFTSDESQPSHFVVTRN